MERSLRRIVLETGIVGGILFTAHASIPYSESWPMIWPALAGGTAVWFATREPHPHRWRTGLLAALLTGVVTGAIAFVGLSIVIYVAMHSGMAEAVRQRRVSAGLAAPLTVAGALAIAAGLAAADFIVGFLGGVLVLPARYI